MGVEADRTGRRPRRDPRRERNRRRLIDATLELMAEGGPGSLRPASVCRAADMDPAAFYVHFKNIAECEQAAAAALDEYLERHLKAYAAVRGQSDDAMAATAYATLYRSWLAEPRWCALMLRARQHRASPIGQKMRAIVELVRADVTELLWQLAMTERVQAWKRKDVELLAELCVGTFMTVFEGLAEGRQQDVDAAALAVARANQAIILAEIQRAQASA
jgi:AcrR family transcriptional regulator